MEQRPTESDSDKWQSYARRVGGTTLVLMVVNTAQAIGVADIIADRDAESLEAHRAALRPPAQVELVDTEAEGNGTTVDVETDTTLVGESLDSPETQVLPDLGIEWLPPTVKYWSPQIVAAAEEFGVDPQLVAIKMTIESGGYQYASSNSTPPSRGLMQIWPKTETRLAEQLGYTTGNYDIFDPTVNIRMGAQEIANIINDNTYNIHSHQDLVRIVAAGYNGGQKQVNKMLANLPMFSETKWHVWYAERLWLEKDLLQSPHFSRWTNPEFGNGQRLINLAEQELANQGVDWSHITWE